jgi:hypothetical protein
MRTAHSLLRLVSILLDLAQDALQFLLLGTRSSAALEAENIFLCKQLALYLEREAKPRRATDATIYGSALAAFCMAEYLDQRVPGELLFRVTTGHVTLLRPKRPAHAPLCSSSQSR